MIIVRTPLRISLAGGGTDLPAFYASSPTSFGAVVSFGIDKYVTVAIADKFDGRTRVSYSMTENVESPKYLQHDIIRESLQYFGVQGLEVVTVSDIPGEGTGLGSSSSLAVGLVHALHKLRGESVNGHPNLLAEGAYYIERLICGHPCGKQDHYAAAYGSLHSYRFMSDEAVLPRLLPLHAEEKAFLENDLMLFYTGRTRQASSLLKNVADGFRHSETTQAFGLRIRDIALELESELIKGNLNSIAPCLHEGWLMKKQLTPGISDLQLDEIYQTALRAGAGGGKLLGAGGGGFFLFAGCWNHQAEIERALGLRRVMFKIDTMGSRIVYHD